MTCEIPCDNKWTELNLYFSIVCGGVDNFPINEHNTTLLALPVNQLKTYTVNNKFGKALGALLQR